MEPSPRTGGIRRLTRGEKAKLTVLLSAMTPYAVQIFNTENPTSRGCADDLEEAFFDAGWTITIRQTIRDAFGYTVVGGPPSLGPLPPEPDLNDFVGTKALAVIGMLQDFHLHVGGMGVGVHPANTISVIVGDEPPVADSSSASYPPHAAD